MPRDPILHAAFGDAASGHLKHALRLLGRREAVILLPDDLSTGPIDRVDGESRGSWVHEQLRCDVYEEDTASIDRFWAEVASPSNRIVAWVSRRSPAEYAGLLALVSQREDRPLEIIDATEVPFIGADGKPDPQMSLGMGGVPATQSVDLKLAERAAPLSSSVASRYRQAWARLKRENALLRVVDGDDLVSAPITHFDSRIESFATNQWQLTARVIGAFYRSAFAAVIRPPGDQFIWRRVVAMVEAGALEGKGDFARIGGMRRSWVRRPRRLRAI